MAYPYPGGYPPYPGGYQATPYPSPLPPPYGAAAGSYPRAYYYIRSRLNGLVMDIEGGNRNPGARVIMWNQKGTFDSDNQLWYDDLATGTIRSKMHDFCLHVDGQTVVVRPYQYSDPNQQWVRADPFIQNRYSPSRVFDIANNNASAGAHLVVWDRHGGSNQCFDFVFIGGMPPPPAFPPVSRPLFYIVSEMHGKVLDISGGSPAPGATVIVWPKKPGASRNQLWYFDSEGVIRSALNDFALEACGDGAGLKMMPYNGSVHQRWLLHGNRIMKNHHECLDICNEDRNDGAGVISYRYKGSSNQHWRLEYV